MRKFIVSDIHGNGNVYYSIMGYLDNISKEEEIELYINGDLIDRGDYSSEILLDVMKRIKENKFKIVYLAGNHELLMHNYYKKKMEGKNTSFNNWFLNGGDVTNTGLINALKDEEKIYEVSSFISNLKIYEKFEEKINDKNILLVHASFPFKVNDICNFKVKDKDIRVLYSLWARRDMFHPFKLNLENKKYFSILGHTPNDSKYGFVYDKKNNYLNIDGGSSLYVGGQQDYDHIPLVEIKDNYLKILTFNNNNEIIYGNYLYNNKIVPISLNELQKDREYLKENLDLKENIK